MATALKTEYEVRISLPAEAFRHHPWQPLEIAERMRILWLIELVRERRIGYGRAAELSRMPKADFVILMGQHKVSPVDFDPLEVERELEAAEILSQI